MNSPLSHTFIRASALLATACSVLDTQAAVTTYTSSVGFLANTTTTNLATFEGLATGSRGSTLTTNGITITSLPGGISLHDVYIAPASNVFFGVPNTSAVLTANGDENFRFQLAAGGTFSAVGFDFYSNPYGAPVFALFDSNAVLIQSISVPQAVSSLGFIGFTSTTPIAYITTTVDRGWQVDTAFDNLRIGGVTAVPEPQVGWLLLAGLAATAGLVRHRATHTG